MAKTPEQIAAEEKAAAAAQQQQRGAAPPPTPQGATPSRPKEVLSEMEQDSPRVRGEQEPERKTDRAPRDNRRIVQGVQFPAAGGRFETFAANTPEELDKLEARMTPEQCEYLKQQGAIEGDWSPSGKPAPPMVGSRAELGQRGIKLGPSTDQAELERLRAENQQLKAQADKAKK
jgi:hypothetical protein